MIAQVGRGPYREDVPDPRRLRILHDALLASLVGLLGLAEIWVPLPSVQGDGSQGVSSVVVVALSIALAFRRRWALPSALVTLLTWPVVFLVDPILVLFFGQFLPMVVAVFSIARHGRGREPLYGALAGVAALLFFDFFVDALGQVSEIVFHWGVFLIAFGFGTGLRRMEHRAATAVQRAVEAERSAGEKAAAAVIGERTRIARELHDVVAHAVSMMVVQAGAASLVVDDDPEQVREALQRIRESGTAALDEMRRVVTMLRDEDTAGVLAPQPQASDVHRLVHELREMGVDVVLSVSGEHRDLPVGLDLTAYRIVQEALTNVRRHAPRSRATVVLDYTAGGLRIEVTDDGDGPASDSGGSGHGLIGMRERVLMYGGTLEAGPQPGGGFGVRALLPVGAP